MPISRPPKKWWDECVRSVRGENRAKVCGAIWRGISQSKKKAIRKGGLGFNPAEVLLANPKPRNPRKGFRIVALARNPVNPAAPAFISQTYRTKEEAKAAMKHVDPREFFRPHIQRAPLLAENPSPELVVMTANPGGNPNPSAPELYETFQGKKPEWVTISNQPHMPAGDYAALGELVELAVKPLCGGQVLAIRNFGRSLPLSKREGEELTSPSLASVVFANGAGRQLYFVGSNQDMALALDEFGARKRSDGKFELGEARAIIYRAEKGLSDFKSENWIHNFGEESGARPATLFDPKHKKLLLEGGNYRVEAPGIID